MKMQNKIITIFGGSGFIGRNIVKELAKSHDLINVVTRDPEKSLESKTSGAVGQITITKGNILDDIDLENNIKNAQIVINLVGILYEKGQQNFSSIQAQAAEKIAKLSTKYGVKQLIHFSALGVDKATASKYARSKLAGEKAVLSAFPNATIIRPSIVFGRYDNFFNQFAKIAKISPILPLIGGGHTKFQPVYVGDIARAIAKIVEKEELQGKIYEFGGKDIVSFRQILEFIAKIIGKKRIFLNIPFTIASIESILLELLPHPILTRDQVTLLRYDNIVTHSQPVLEDIGINPASFIDIVPDYIKD